MFKNELLERTDRYTRAARTFNALSRWIAVRVDVLGSLFAASLAAYLTYGSNHNNPSNIGFSLNQAGSFCVHSMINYTSLTTSLLSRVFEFDPYMDSGIERGRK
jgi:hypothetical protein